jgi:hypothetical protein
MRSWRQVKAIEGCFAPWKSSLSIVTKEVVAVTPTMLAALCSF